MVVRLWAGQPVDCSLVRHRNRESMGWRMSSDTTVGSVRTCVGCRQRTDKRELLRVVAGDRGSGREVVPDPAGRAPGRGAHLHPTAGCLELALRRRAFPRALRAEGGLLTKAVEEYVASDSRRSTGDRDG
jgi:predicted RNA-binding protein YlxR (DUF448 family)